MCSVYTVCVVMCCGSRGAFLCAMCVVIVIIQVAPRVLNEHITRYCIAV